MPIQLGLEAGYLPKQVLYKSDIYASADLFAAADQCLIDKIENRLMSFEADAFEHFTIQGFGQAFKPRIGKIRI